MYLLDVISSFTKCLSLPSKYFECFSSCHISTQCKMLLGKASFKVHVVLPRKHPISNMLLSSGNVVANSKIDSKSDLDIKLGMSYM